MYIIKYSLLLNRDFNLILTPSLSTIRRSLTVTVVTKTGVQNRPFPYNNIYSGHMLGKTMWLVHTHTIYVHSSAAPNMGIMWHHIIYCVTCAGSPDSHVTAQLHPLSGILTATVHSREEVYYIEPLSQHFGGSHDSHMITYKHSHLKFNLTG